MAAINISLDKSMDSILDQGFGTIIIRVVVLEKKKWAQSEPSSDAPEDAEPDELLPESDKRPTSSYLESSKRGRLCGVFVVNGQRQHAWDNHFIVRDLELKYLRNRMIVIVDVDGLKAEAIAHLMQGSRHGFYEGRVYDVLRSRVIATLKGDPDLQRLEAEAEDEVSSLETGDEVVKAALDQLIQEHHKWGDRSAHGHQQQGDESREDVTAGSLVQTTSVVKEGEPDEGESAAGPVLVMRPDLTTIRLKPNETKRVCFHSRPDEAWPSVEKFAVTVQPAVEGMRMTPSMQTDSALVDLMFDAQSDFESDEYPVETTLRAVATFERREEPRVSEHRVVIMPPKNIPPSPPPKLLDKPTFIKVASRQPVKITAGGPDVHVKIKWDGKDHLATGVPPAWSFNAKCLSGHPFTGMAFTRPSQGRFELLLQVPKGLELGEKVLFQVDAFGPDDTGLITGFEAEVVEPRGPRKTTEQLAGGSQRRPPYELVYVKEENWEEETCWEATSWTDEDPGCFQLPTQTNPVTLLINQDMSILQNYKESLIRRRLAEQTIQERTTKYTSHVAFHLWQMYLNDRERGQAKPDGEEANGPSEEEMRQEIKRVAYTLVRLMEVSQ